MANGDGPSTATVVRIVLTVAGVLVLLYGAYLIRAILVLAVIALFLAVGMDPAVRGLARLRLKRGQAVLVVFLAALLFIGGFIGSVTPPLVREVQELAGNIPSYARELATRSDSFREIDAQYDISGRLRSALDNLPAIAAGSVGGALGVLRGIGRTLFSVVTVTILTIYFMLDLPKLLDGAQKLLPRSRRERFQELRKHVLDRISGYMLGQIMVSLTAGLVSVIVLSILRVPYSLPLGMWVAISALIPMVGATIGAVPAVIVAFLHSVPIGIATLVFFLVYQQVENYVVAPRVMRRAVDISPAAVIMAALIGGTLMGFVGALLAIPTAASLKVLAQELWMPRQDAA